jgi:hypothetical protein
MGADALADSGMKILDDSGGRAGDFFSLL